MSDQRMLQEQYIDRREHGSAHTEVLHKFLVFVFLAGLSVSFLLFLWREPQTRPSSREKCDLFYGEWVPHPPGPAYSNDSCLFIDAYANCVLNGRPDKGYLYWRWKPKGCELQLFDAERFLDGVRNKWWAFIGDSISRSHVQSLLCLLSRVEQPREVFRDEAWRSRRWYFSSYNFTVSAIWSPFLVKAEIDYSDGVSSKDIELYLDVLHVEWASELKNFDCAIASGGKWFLRTAIYYEKNEIVGCHYCPGKNLTDLGYQYGYRKVLNRVFRHVASSDFKGTFLFRPSTPAHFENGEWSEGGSCKRTHPFKEGEWTLTVAEQVMRKVENEAFEQAAVRARTHGVDLRLLDTTYLSMLRPDGHPGQYVSQQSFTKNESAKVRPDCFHWCLPGPIDQWNDVLMETLFNHTP